VPAMLLERGSAVSRLAPGVLRQRKFREDKPFFALAGKLFFADHEKLLFHL